MPCNDFYDPAHKDADWSGFIPKRSNRKHITTHPVQLESVDGNTITPSVEAQTDEWTKPARKIVGHEESGADIDDSNTNPNQSVNDFKRSLTFSLIGGPIPANCPESVSSTCWETETQAATRKKGTDLHQLTDNGRSMHVRGRKRRASVNKNGISTFNYNSLSENESRNYGSEESCGSNEDLFDFVGFRAVDSSRCKSACFLKHIGKEIAKDTKFEAPKFVSTAPFATDGNLPTDPYKTVSGERKKDLLLENFSSVVPGYTGKRSFID